MSLLDVLEGQPADRIAIVVPDAGARITYGSLRNQVEAMAEAFAAAGIGRGDRVALALPNGPPAIVCFLAASLAGAAAPLNPGYREEEFRFYLEDTAARLLVVPPDAGEEARRAAEGRMPILEAAIDAQGVVRLAGGGAGRTGRNACATETDVALVLHTSGSTGRPKRVPLSHGNLLVSLDNIVNTYQLGPDDVALCLMPLFHVHGLMASALATLRSGGTVVIPSRFNALSFWRLVRESGTTWYSAVPTIHQLILARLGQERPPGAERLRFIRSCSAPLAVETAQRLEAVIGAPVLEAYGMTEASHQMSSNPLPPAQRKFGTVGPGTGVEISIMDATGSHLDSGQVGEVVIRGPNVTAGYENNPEANASSFTNGWFLTGDQGVLDSAGYLRLTGRLKELINRGGEKISPLEIDEVLRGHPAVAEAVCFGVPHPSWGEEVAAAVVLNNAASEADLLAYCRDRLADFKRPKKIHIVDAIPRTATGKIQRRVVAEALAAPQA